VTSVLLHQSSLRPCRPLIKLQSQRSQKAWNLLPAFHPELDCLPDLASEDTVRTTTDLHRSILAIESDTVLFLLAVTVDVTWV
jgi:hypothetical protein